MNRIIHLNEQQFYRLYNRRRFAGLVIQTLVSSDVAYYSIASRKELINASSSKNGRKQKRYLMPPAIISNMAVQPNIRHMFTGPAKNLLNKEISTFSNSFFITSSVQLNIKNCSPILSFLKTFRMSQLENCVLSGNRQFSTSTSTQTNQCEKSETDTSAEDWRIVSLVEEFQRRGHFFAKTDPLNLPIRPKFFRQAYCEAHNRPIDYKAHGFTEQDLDRTFSVPKCKSTGFLEQKDRKVMLRDFIKRLEETYCNSIGVEISHIDNKEMKEFIFKQIETPKKLAFDPEFKKKILKRTLRAVVFERFCGIKFNTAKRFGIDGCETAITMIKTITKDAAKQDIHTILIGMPHRGRLNLLLNVLHKPMQAMLNEFRGITGYTNTEWGNTGDVKYHLGVAYDHFDEETKKKIHMCVASNPSHLEAVDAVVLGQARAKQYFSQDSSRLAVLPILMHGDSSFSGQGIVYESLQMSQLQNYTVGGTIHVIVNNQIGFTTESSDQSSGAYCTDVAKSLDSPIFHVNAEDPEACVFVAQLALKIRQKFQKDVFIEIVGYRRFGHNELDMPKFTQPHMYKIIEKRKDVFDLYAERLIKENVVTQKEVDDIKRDCLGYYNKQYEESKKTKSVIKHTYRKQWQEMSAPSIPCPPKPTGVKIEKLKEIGKEISTLPSKNLNPHPTIKRIYIQRLQSVESGKDIDYGGAEALSFAATLNDGYHVRIMGQDTERGTFSHRHSVVHDQKKINSYCPLVEFTKARKLPHAFEVGNSPLNEYASMSYELGYANENPNALVIWEAQFGDFANGAQIVIDQFIASAETKWGDQCGIVLLLPHGYDGQGPEHSSARMERFLQLCDDREDVIHPNSWDAEKRCVIQKHNFQVVYCSTPANLFHMLRRQVHRGFRKPVVCFLSKRLLKMRAAFSKLEEMEEGTQFIRYIPDLSQAPPNFSIALKNIKTLITKPNPDIRRLILCTGQIYYDLVAYREKHQIKNVAISRVEQLSPFPFDCLIDDIKRLPNLKDIVWAQEEIMNGGAWFYASKRIESSLKYLNYPNEIKYPVYVGRDVNGAPACGDTNLYEQELDQLLKDAYDFNRVDASYYEKYLKE